MGYDVFKFGALYLEDKIQPIPKQPTDVGNIPSYDGKATISIAPANQEESITWIKPNGRNLLVADRALLVSVSQEDLYKNGFIDGKMVLFDGQYFRCRLLQVGEDEGVPNEWDTILYETGEDDALWHWSKMYFYGADVSFYDVLKCAVRGYLSARLWNDYTATNRSTRVGFRPALEPLSSDNPTPNINLDGMDFQLTSIPGNDTFCPILQPIQGDVFKDIPVGSKVRMYTFTENGQPVHMDEQVKDPAKLTLTDHYFGDEYLVPWVISNGVAVARQSLNQ